MTPFKYTRPADIATAVEAVSGDPGARFLAGGTNIVDLMREGVERPVHLVDLTRLPLSAIEDVEGGLRIGALTRNSELAEDCRVQERYPLLARAVLSGASPQLRNMATVGGNLMQRTRCFYFYDVASACNKRVPGAGCDALAGYNRFHAVLGSSENCIAAHPSDMCVALAALDAVVNVEGANGQRRLIPLAEFHRLPGDTPHIETELRHGELITSVHLPPPPPGRAAYVKLRDRATFAFALVSVAAIIEVNGHTVTSARLALGGVAHKPWRVYAAEQLLTGAKADPEIFHRAAAIAVDGARPYEHNAFKVELTKRLIVRTLRALTAANGGHP